MFIFRKASIFLVLLISYSISSSATNTFYRPTNNHAQRYSVCNSKTCHQYVNMLRENMDLTVDPCTDFYRFSCGNFIKRSNISDDQTQVSQFKNLDKSVKAKVADLLGSKTLSTDDKWSKNAKTFYSSCINKDYVNQFTEPYMLKLLDEIGGWPLASGKANPNSHLSLQKLLNKYGFSEFAQITVSPNPKDPMKYILKIYQPDGDQYDFFEKESYVNAYKSYLKIVAGYLNPNRPVSDIEKDVDDLFDLEKSLAQIRLTPSERRSSVNNIEMTIGDLQEKIPNYPWLELITNGMFSNNPDIKINKSEPISIDDWNYLYKMQSIYSDYAKNHETILQNYIIAGFFNSDINDFLPDKYLLAKLLLTKEVSGVKALQDRKQFCVSKAQSYLPNEVGKVYVNKYFSKKAKSDAVEMTQNILNEFKQMLKENTWMDSTSRAKAIEKANYIKPQIGYPDFYDNATYVDKNYNYEIDPFNLLKNVLVIDEYWQRYLTLGFLRNKVDRDLWFTTPAIVNAFYEPNNNQIYFPAGILNPPFYDASLPKYINYGAIGMVIGHEITHGFDDEGRHYDKIGRYYTDIEQGLWTTQTIEAFKKKTKCMIDQYNGFNVTEINRNINGVQTLGENIADNGGIKEAYRTYVNYMKNKIPEAKLPNVRMTANQLIFVGMSQVWCSKIKKETLLNNVLSDVHSIPEFRVKGMIQNSDYFRAAFNCKKSTSVNSCSIW